MMQLLSKSLERHALTKLLANEIGRDGLAHAYERSPYYVMNAVRRGADVVALDEGILVFAEHLDQRGSSSLVFFSHGRLLQPELLASATRKCVGDRGLFIHHLLPHTRDRLLTRWPMARVTDHSLSASLGACFDEDTYPQVILLPKQLPRTSGSVAEKRKVLDDLVRSSRHLSRELAAYYNQVERETSGPVYWVGELPAPAPLAGLIHQAIAAVTANWLDELHPINEHTCRCHTSAMQNMTDLLTKEPLALEGRRIVARTVFNWKTNHGGFWLAELDELQSMLIPHVIVSDLHYKCQYTFLLYDILRWAYIHGVSAINLGGSETEALFSLKSQLFDVLPASARKLRKLDTVYVPPGGLPGGY